MPVMRRVEDYYSQPELWELDRYQVDPGQRLRARVIAALVEPTVDSILDVGCGNGFVTRHLKARQRVVGLDPSETALACFNGTALVGSGDYLPFPDGSFDAAVCAEVLEHLPPEVLAATVAELKRVTRKFIVIGVPCQEDLRSGMTTCSQCGQRYHIYLHQRSFRNPEDILRLFPGWGQEALVFVGTRGEGRFAALRWIRWLLLGPHATSSLAQCPNCAAKGPLDGDMSRRRLSRRIREALAWRLPQRAAPRWMILLLRRDEKRNSRV